MKQPEKEELQGVLDVLYDKLMDDAVAKHLLRPVGEKRNRGRGLPDNRTLAEIQQSLLPKAYELRAEVCEQTKNYVFHLKNRNIEEVLDASGKAKKAMQELQTLGLDQEYLQEFLQSAGQELVEMLLVGPLLLILNGNYEGARKEIANLVLPDDDELRIPYKAYLGGVEDAITEVGKIMQDILIEEDPENLSAYEAYFFRMYKVAETLYRYLEKYETTNRRFLNNSPFRGQGFNDKLRRIKQFISERLQPQVIRSRMDVLLIKQMGNQQAAS